MDRYLIAVGCEDKPTILWQLEILYYSYCKYVDKSVYDLMFYVALWDNFPPSNWLKQLIAMGLPITLTPEYAKTLGQDGVDNKYCTIFNHALDKLDGRHLIIMDSDIILLPKFNELFRLAPGNVLAFEVNEIHRTRVEGLVGYYNARYGAALKADDVLVAPSLIIRSDFAKQFLTEYMALIRDCPDSGKRANKSEEYNPRAATMVGKGCLQAHHKYPMNVIPQFLSNNDTLESRERVFDYADLHYWGKDKLFDKRLYREKTPFDVQPKSWNGAGYRASEFIWEIISEMQIAENSRKF